MKKTARLIFSMLVLVCFSSAAFALPSSPSYFKKDGDGIKTKDNVCHVAIGRVAPAGCTDRRNTMSVSIDTDDQTKVNRLRIDLAQATIDMAEVKTSDLDSRQAKETAKTMLALCSCIQATVTGFLTMFDLEKNCRGKKRGGRTIQLLVMIGKSMFRGNLLNRPSDIYGQF